MVLDAKGTTNRGIDIGRGVFLGRGTILSCKDGDIVLGDHANIGFHCEVFSGSSVTVGRTRSSPRRSTWWAVATSSRRATRP